ncbi:foldase protein PrsA [Caldanaerobacter subterraneus subsp. tengcongensis MB4]|uniref:peptidylprolyl isomerase n=1 Tax=Caldanaerobacter subterraneus subsp. tengcongensis (strain DSM 15242 / JCM 11007 / NBRC 100824 / MB4) TaxID=273068 RepID=Q8R8C8_CALS4|nr:SurA N-terminal domain-containing protein [Caldanaerobacter subterraneus]AAM25251.1 Parvulin-like peptidyl-prolyl isomerase [Caldanaerobacter subterraneus subsp. tengcongensis MB4]MCS3915153.1 foldase protein PrsA [Caldanaerobacter subterraneus subsp. tengcongensis MB4]
MKKIVLLLILPVFALSILSGCGSKQIASVHGIPITQAELEREKAFLKNDFAKMSDEELTKTALENLKAKKAVEYEAQKEGIAVTDEELNKAWQNIKDKTKLTKEDLKDILLSDKLFNKYTKDITVNPEEVEQFYETHKDYYTTVKVYEISVRDKDTADMVYQKLKSGEDFSKLFEQYSIDRISGNGGFMGEIPVSQKFFGVSLKPDTIYEPIPVNNEGYIILKTTEQIIKPFDEVKDGIELYLLNQKKLDFYHKKIKEWEGEGN